jgi:hypothetical protein
MMEPTESVKKEDIAPPYLGRNMAAQHANTDVSYVDTFENMTHYDDQSAFIAPGSYKILLSHEFRFVKNNVRKLRKKERGSAESGGEGGKVVNEKFRERFVLNTEWMKDQPAENVERRKQVYETAVNGQGEGEGETLVDFEERLAGMGLGNGNAAATARDGEDGVRSGTA